MNIPNPIRNKLMEFEKTEPSIASKYYLGYIVMTVLGRTYNSY